MAASQSALHVSTNIFVNNIMIELWYHSHACALGCQWLAMNTGYRNIAEQAYLAGLLHDVGKLFLLKALERLTNAGMAQAALERGLLLEIFTEMHVEQGLRLMEHWNMPPSYRSVVACHHLDVERSSANLDDILLTIVKFVDVATRKRDLSLSTDSDSQSLLELPEAQLLKITDDQLRELYGIFEKSRGTI
jgi:HD-like signal output (HDOD) protein